MDELRHWLVLSRAPGLGPRTFRQLIKVFGDPAGIVGAAPTQLRAYGLDKETIDYLHQPDDALLQQDQQWLSSPGNGLLPCTDPDYPPLLRRLDDAPFLLYVSGDSSVLWQPQIAIVGSRRASAGGLDNARAFARHLSSAGFAITSGLATGIDGAAHAAALAAGGSTVAVLGTGPDRCYPDSHRRLAADISGNGALVSEWPPGTPPRAGHFPRRNRIISGLALGVLVVEAGVRSGSLITARCAAEQGREVFAVPGSIHNPVSRGCHRLIRQGAKLVETGKDVVDELAPLARELALQLHARLDMGAKNANHRTTNAGTIDDALDDEYRALLGAMGHDPVAVDTLVKRTGLTSDSVSSMLLMLELKGTVNNVGGGLYSLMAETPV